MGQPSAEAEYPIAAVSKLTGVSCHALRVWERRYGFPVPLRSQSGHRRYRHEQVTALKQLSELARGGRPIGDLIAEMLAGRLDAQVVPAAAPAVEVESSVEGEVAEFLRLMLAGNLDAACAVYDRNAARLGPEDLVSRLIAPALTEVGESWFRRVCSVHQERYIGGFLRIKLGALVDEARRANSRPIHTAIVGTVQGDRHEGGGLIAALFLERAGWRVLNLGVDLPVTEYVRAVELLHPDAVALSFVLSRNVNKRFQELSRIQQVPVFVGGRSILNYQKLARSHGLIPVTGPVGSAVSLMLDEFEAWRNSHPPRRPQPEAPSRARRSSHADLAEREGGERGNSCRIDADRW
jgi:methanogenic corrinoid protein MtbC1